MALFDALIGKNAIDKQRGIADEAARLEFDPNVLSPALDEASIQAQEGIVDAPIRERSIERIFSQTEISPEDVGASSGRFLSFMGQLNEQKTDALADVESKIALEEETAKREGRGRVAEIMSQRRQLESKREAQMVQNRLMAEAEAQKRRGQLFGSIAGFGLSAVGGAPAIGKKIGSALGLDMLGLNKPETENPEPEFEPVEEDMSDIDIGLEEEIDNFIGF